MELIFAGKQRTGKSNEFTPIDFCDSLSDSFTMFTSLDGHETHPVIEYDPLMLDDPELTCGKHRKVLTLHSFTVCLYILC